ncbi:rubrerythrin-like domain-containing protein [Halorubrum tibetense]|uniref:Rubrerythrin-like domain-containing protein n=1 Tax=Halorubrum tibetense TaxID=175631 RepID=A0ABD5SAW7_9EURY
MRPNCKNSGEELYECFECGARGETPGRCECGGELQHLGRSRDL